VIEGVMPKWQRYLHNSATVFMSVLVVGMTLLYARFIIPPAHTGSAKARFFLSFLFVAFAVFGIGSLIWYHRRIIAEFRYDGSALRYRTLGTREPQDRPLADIASIRDWRGRGGQLGYRLQFQDKQKLYLEFSVSNSIALANRLQAELHT
jgi:hypothetical protein